MTVLTACQEAAIELNQSPPSSLFSTTDKFAVEIRTQANKSAKAILKAYDWQKFTLLKTMTGDGVTTSFPLPADYDRMPKKSSVLTSQFAMPLVKTTDVDEWLEMQIRSFIAAPGKWIILAGAMQILPAPATGVEAKYYYISNLVVSNGTKAAFNTDGDTFDLPERLLTLDMIWRWRAQKKMDYAEDMRNFEIALAEEMANDKGSRVLVSGWRRDTYDVRNAYPRPLGS